MFFQIFMAFHLNILDKKMSFQIFQSCIMIVVALCALYATFIKDSHGDGYSYGIAMKEPSTQRNDDLTVKVPNPTIFKCPYDDNKTAITTRCAMVEEFTVEDDSTCDCHHRTIKVHYTLRFEKWKSLPAPKSSTASLPENSAATATKQSHETPVCLPIKGTLTGNIGYLTQEGTLENDPVFDNSTCPLYLRLYFDP